ncbi:MAG: ArnT family glycosyltransferase [Planctomycetota bacterium]
MENLVKSEKLKFYHRFWFWVALIAILLIATHARDITRPYYGLHSWGEASIAWRSRVYLKYPVSYTKLLSTWAVGDPPSPQTPQHYLDHPQLGMLLRAADMAVFGINEYAQRIGSIIRALFCLYFFMKILKGLTDKPTAILAGLIFVLFPLAQYFPVRDWCFPLGFLTTWFYLVVIGALKGQPEPKKRHIWGLALSLFFIVQMAWTGFFYAMAVGIHYVFRCLYRRKMPSFLLIAIMVIAPFSSLFFNFAVMAYGHDWQWGKILELYKWRAGSGELQELPWSRWFATFWSHAIDNFTLTVLIIAIAYLTIGQVFVLINRSPKTKKQKAKKSVSRKFPQFWLILMPALFQLFLLKGTLTAHQYWERPMAPFVAIAAALGIMVIYDLFKKIHQYAAYTAVTLLLAACAVFCWIGSNFYYAVRWQQPAKIEMFKMLNENIPPDKALLSFEKFTVFQNEVKGEFYRPEIAWYLDREIVQAKSFEEVKQKAATGKFPYYLVHLHTPPSGRTEKLLQNRNLLYNQYNIALKKGNLSQADLNRLLNEAKRIDGQAKQSYQKDVIRWNEFLNSLNRTFTHYKQLPGVKGERITNGKYFKPDGKFIKAGMPTYLIFDLQGKPAFE